MYKNTWWLDRINKFGTWEFLNVRFRSKKREEFNSRLNKSENSALMLKKGEREMFGWILWFGADASEWREKKAGQNGAEHGGKRQERQY